MRPNLATDFATIFFFGLTAFFLASRSRFSLSTVSVLLSPLHAFALTTQARCFVRFFVLRRIVRLERSASADGKTADPNLLRLLSPLTLFLRLPLLDAVYLLRNQICRARSPRTPRRRYPLAVVVQVDLLSIPWDASTNLQYLRASFNGLLLTHRAPVNIDGVEDTGYDTLSSHAYTQQTGTMLA